MRTRKGRQFHRRLGAFLPIGPVGLIAILGVVALHHLKEPNAARFAEPTASSGWPIGVTLRHYRARRNCDAAWAVGLAPARLGEPGYWDHLDADGDGISCEPWSRR